MSEPVSFSIGVGSSSADRSVRPALVSDARAIADLQHGAFGRFVQRSLGLAQGQVHEFVPSVEELEVQWSESLSVPAPPGCATLVAIHGSQVGAFVLAVPGEVVPEIKGKRPEIGEGTELASLVVRPEFERSGHGSRLLSAVRDSLGGANIRIWIAAEDEARQRFVQSAGFAPAGVRRELQVGDRTVVEHLWWAQID